MKIKQQKQIKEFLIEQFGEEKATSIFSEQEKLLAELIESQKNKSENQMKTLTETLLPRISLYKILQNDGMSQ